MIVHAPLAFPHMRLSNEGRRIVAGITAVVLLLCQSTALAHVCAASVAQPAASVTHLPCHDSGGNDAQGTANDFHAAPCLSQATSSSPAFPDISPLANLPALVVPASPPAIVGAGLPLSNPPLLRGEPPPLRTLYCCLRN